MSSWLYITGLMVLFIVLGCTYEPRHVPQFPNKISFSLDHLDAEGLLGPSDGKRALSYEFCIPSEKVREVANIDETAQFLRSPGRIGCTQGQILCLGHTHQPEYAQVLSRLSRLDYIEEIREAYFE